MLRLSILALTLVAASTGATLPQSKQARAAEAFKLDSLAPEPTATPSPNPSPTPAEPPVLATPAVPDSAEVTGAPAADTLLRPTFTLDTPIAVLIASPAARAVLDRDLPGLSSDENLDKFAKLGLRQFQPLTGGQLTDAMLTKVARDLSKLGGPTLAPIVPTAGGTSKRNNDDSR